jgi:hypothetical protein
MATKVILIKTPEEYNDVSPSPEDGKRVRFDGRPIDAKLVMAAELELELELKVVSATRADDEEIDVVVVRCLVGRVLHAVVLEVLLPLEETKLEENELEETELEETELEETELEETGLEEAEMDITAPETWGASSFEPPISARAVSLTI